MEVLSRATAPRRRWAPAQWPTGPPVRPLSAVAVVVGSYLVAFGTGVLDSIFSLTGDASVPSRIGAADAVTSTADAIATAGGGIAVALLGAAALGVRPSLMGLRAHPGRRIGAVPGGRGTELAAAVVFLVAIGVSVLIQEGVAGPGYPFDPGRWAALPDFVTSALAGPQEEIVVVAVPTALLRRAGWSWPAMGAATCCCGSRSTSTTALGSSGSRCGH